MDYELSCRYVRNLLGPMTTYLKDISIQNNLKGFAQQADVIYTVSWMTRDAFALLFLDRA